MDNETYVLQVRALIGDDSPNDPTYTDVQIIALKGLFESPYGAAITLLERLAVEEALLHKYVKSYDIVIDGSKGANVVLARAERLRGEQDKADQGALADAFIIVDHPGYSPLEYSERYCW